MILAVASVSPTTKAYFQTSLADRRYSEAEILLLANHDIAPLETFVEEVRQAQDTIANVSDEEKKEELKETLIAKIDDYQARLTNVQTQIVAQQEEPSQQTQPQQKIVEKTVERTVEIPSPTSAPSQAQTQLPQATPVPTSIPTPVVTTPVPPPDIDDAIEKAKDKLEKIKEKAKKEREERRQQKNNSVHENNGDKENRRERNSGVDKVKNLFKPLCFSAVTK